MNAIFSVPQNRRGILKSGAGLAAGLLIGGPSAKRSAFAAQSSIFAAGEGAVFVGTNHNNTTAAAEPANEVVMYRRAANGQLAMIGAFATGGQGSGPGQRFAGDGLGSGNSLRLSQDNRWLLVANAGSDTVSVMEVMADGLRLASVTPAGDGSQGHRFPN